MRTGQQADDNCTAIMADPEKSSTEEEKDVNLVSNNSYISWHYF